MTINRSCKDIDGISGNTKNPGATERWIKAHHIVALHEHLNKKIKKKTKERHVELGTARIERDEEDVRNIITCFNAWLPESWEKGHHITNFAMGETAMDDRNDGIIDLRERGEITRNEFAGRFTQENTKLNDLDSIKQPPLKLFEKKTTTKKHSIPEDKDQLFTDIFAICDEEKLDLCKIMDCCVTSKSWTIVNDDEKCCSNNKHLLGSHSQNLSPIFKTHKVPDNISTSIVDVMRAITMISVADLKCTSFSHGEMK